MRILHDFAAKSWVVVVLHIDFPLHKEFLGFFGGVKQPLLYVPWSSPSRFIGDKLIPPLVGILIMGI